MPGKSSTGVKLYQDYTYPLSFGPATGQLRLSFGPRSEKPDCEPTLARWLSVAPAQVRRTQIKDK